MHLEKYYFIHLTIKYIYLTHPIPSSVSINNIFYITVSWSHNRHNFGNSEFVGIFNNSFE